MGNAAVGWPALPRSAPSRLPSTTSWGRHPCMGLLSPALLPGVPGPTFPRCFTSPPPRFVFLLSIYRHLMSAVYIYLLGVGLLLPECQLREVRNLCWSWSLCLDASALACDAISVNSDNFPLPFCPHPSGLRPQSQLSETEAKDRRLPGPPQLQPGGGAENGPLPRPGGLPACGAV